MDIMFIVMPVRYIKPNVAIMEAGMDTPIISADFQSLRNSRSINTATMALSKAVLVTFPIDDFI